MRVAPEPASWHRARPWLLAAVAACLAHALAPLLGLGLRQQLAVQAGLLLLALGLYISKGIAESHGGRLWAESDGPGHGSTFHLAWPLAKTVPQANQGKGAQGAK